MMKKRKIIFIVSVAVLAFAVICGAVIIVVNVVSAKRPGDEPTADINLKATVKNLTVYNAVAVSLGTDGSFKDENGNEYIYREDDVHGNVTLSDDSVEIKNIAPGDKVEFDIEITSKSTVSFYYRTEILADASQGAKLLNQLDFTAGELGLMRNDAGGETGTLEAVLVGYTEWKALGSSQTKVETVRVAISLPVTAKEGGGETVKLYFRVKGRQNTEASEDVSKVITPDANRLSRLWTKPLDPDQIK